MNSAINYFFEQNLGTANENCKVYFDFINSGQSNLISNKSGDFSISGLILPAINSGTLYTGSVYLNSGNYIRVLNTTGVNHKNFTCSLIFETMSSGGGVLLSTFSTGNIQTYDEFGISQNNIAYKGFNFGITAGNNLFFEYYDNEPVSFISDFNMGDQNSVFLNITENNMSFGTFDFTRGQLVSNNFYINTDYLFDQKEFYIGYNPNGSNSYIYNKVFTGRLEQFFIFSPFIYDYDLVNLNSGYVHMYDTGVYYINIDAITGVTGYTTGITGYNTVVTGTEFVATGVIVGEFGEVYSGYAENILTGILPIYGEIALTGVSELIIESGFSGSGPVLNKDYLQKFNKKHINLLSKVDNEDIIELNLFTDTNVNYDLRKNVKLNYQKFNNRFVFPNDTPDGKNFVLYVNGQLQNSGSFLVTGSVYNSGLFILNDYFIDRNNVYFHFNYNENDSVFFDIVTGFDTGLSISNFTVPTGTGLLEITGWNGDLYNLYFNGQKLIKNVHFQTNVNGAIFFDKTSGLYSGASGILLGIPKYSTNIITGSENIFFINSGYFYNFSEVYKNGIRQTINNDYLELGQYDLKARKGIFDQPVEIIYNNEGFFNL